MTIMKALTCLLALGFTLMLTGCKTSDSAAKTGSKRALYVCGCGADCTCKTPASIKPGKCGCGRELAPTHVTKVEGDVASVCVCGTDCTCTGDPKDATKCGCGKPIQKVSLKGTGLYSCNCGGTCGCCTVSEKPGKCKCGMQLKKAI